MNLCWGGAFIRWGLPIISMWGRTMPGLMFPVNCGGLVTALCKGPIHWLDWNDLGGIWLYAGGGISGGCSGVEMSDVREGRKED